MTILKSWPRQGILGFLALLIFVSVSAPAQACSGGVDVLALNLLPDYDAIIYGMVLEIDKRGFSAVMLVDHYFKGSGPQFLPIMRWRPALEVTSAVRGYTTDCLYGGSGPYLYAGQRGYFALKSNGDGTYTHYQTDYLHAPDYDTVGESIFYSESIDGESEVFEVSPEAFRELFLERFSTYDEAILPSEDVPYPLKRWLTITTESGSQYHLNPDRSITPIDLATAPIAISHDGSHVVFRQGNELIVQHYELVLQPDGDYFSTRFSHTLTGDDLLFSPNSSLIAIWDDQLLRVYMFDNFERGGYGQALGMQLIGEHELNLTENTVPLVAWSQNSAVLAFADDTGIWRWPLFIAAEPERIVPDDGVSLLELSLTGRYVRYGDKSEWLLLDTQTGETTPNALSTLDEQNVVLFPLETDNEMASGLSGECQAPLQASCPIKFPDARPIDFLFWHQNQEIAIVTCSSDYENCYVRSKRWDVSKIHSPSRGDHLRFIMPIINALDYDRVYSRPAIAVQDYIIGLSFDFASKAENGWEFQGDYVDLTGIIDSPIVAVEWGQPLFYDSAYYEATE
ncbi:MAG: hypothetical protein CL607_23015 [Anaerolineaceae bacterium]|nr:hypothetical protein [Anaerolineaceae bacterium]